MLEARWKNWYCHLALLVALLHSGQTSSDCLDTSARCPLTSTWEWIDLDNCLLEKSLWQVHSPCVYQVQFSCGGLVLIRVDTVCISRAVRQRLGKIIFLCMHYDSSKRQA